MKLRDMKLLFNNNVYGEYLRVALVEFIRPEQKFNGIEDLTAQIKKDCAQAKLILTEEQY